MKILKEGIDIENIPPPPPLWYELVTLVCGTCLCEFSLEIVDTQNPGVTIMAERQPNGVRSIVCQCPNCKQTVTWASRS